MSVIDKEKKIDEILTRGVGEFVDPGGAFRTKLLRKINGEYVDDIVVKFGVDPTRPDIHLGHAVILRKLRMLQDLGCKIIFLVGDFTATIGDPTGKSKVRPEISQKEVQENMKTYLEQVGIILRTEPEAFAWINNFDWFINVTDLVFPAEMKVTITSGNNSLSLPANTFIGKAARYDQITRQKEFSKNITNVTLRTFLSTLRRLTHSRLIARDMFQERLKAGEELFMHEMMYPVLQGIDSFVIAQLFGSCDLEVGGTDQTFNMLMGRDVMKINNQPQQSVLAFELLEGLDGHEKMSKSLDNYIGITDEPHNMYGKVMSLPDSLIIRYFTLATYTSTHEIQELEKGLNEGSLHPKELKMRLAHEIVSIYHGQETAKAAQEKFTSVFQKGEVPEDVLEISISANTTFVDELVKAEVISSKSEYRRLIEQGAVSNVETGEKIENTDITPPKGVVLRIGKKRFVKIK